MITWHPKYETGHPQIDAEHREFLRQLDVLKEAIDSGAGRERIVDLIVILQRYVLGHFAREEAYMVKVACPATGQNCTAHREFAQKLDRWLEVLTMSGAPVSMVLDVHRESIGWIESHILNVDCHLRRCTPQ